MITKKHIKSVLEENPLHDSDPAKIQKWFEQVVYLLFQEEEQITEEKLNQKADKIDIKALIERSDEKFAALQKETNTRFEALQKEMNARFEAMNARFEALQKEMNARFEAMNARFESLEKRLSIVQWMVTIAFSTLIILNALYAFLKK